jgi:hypothetical protein
MPSAERRSASFGIQVSLKFDDRTHPSLLMHDLGQQGIRLFNETGRP